MDTKSPRLESDESRVIPPPATMNVVCETKPVLHLPNGKVLVRKVGY